MLLLALSMRTILQVSNSLSTEAFRERRGQRSTRIWLTNCHGDRWLKRATLCPPSKSFIPCLRAMNVAKTRCNSVNLPLVVAGYALQFIHIKVERVSEGNFEVRAWERVSE